MVKVLLIPCVSPPTNPVGQGDVTAVVPLNAKQPDSVLVEAGDETVNKVLTAPNPDPEPETSPT